MCARALYYCSNRSIVKEVRWGFPVGHIELPERFRVLPVDVHVFVLKELMHGPEGRGKGHSIVEGQGNPLGAVGES